MEKGMVCEKEKLAGMTVHVPQWVDLIAKNFFSWIFCPESTIIRQNRAGT